MPQVMLILKLLPCLFLLCFGNGVNAATGHSYTEQEEKLILDEVSKYPGESIPIYGMKMYKDIAVKLKHMRDQFPSLYPQDRTPGAVRRYFLHIMIPSKGWAEMPQSLLQKLPISHVPETEHRDVRRGENLSHKRKYVRYIKARSHDDGYTSEEDKYLIDRVLNHPNRPIKVYGKKIWPRIAEQFQEKRRLDPTNFLHDRTGDALRARFRYILNSKLKGKERENLKNQIRGSPTTEYTGEVKILSKHFTREEDKFITNVLLQPSCTSISSKFTWEDMKQKHDEKRIAETPGFLQERTDSSLRARFRYLTLKRGSVSPDLVKKFPDKFPENFLGLQGRTTSTSSFQSQHSELPESDESDREVWTTMVDELLRKCTDGDDISGV